MLIFHIRRCGRDKYFGIFLRPYALTGFFIIIIRHNVVDKITVCVQVNQLFTPNKVSRALSLCTASQVQTRLNMVMITEKCKDSVQVVYKIYILTMLVIPNPLGCPRRHF